MIAKKLIIFSLLLVFTQLSIAQTSSPELGRLFSNSNERHILSRMRTDNRVQENDSIPMLSSVSQGLLGGEVKQEKKSQPIMINGLVRQGSKQGIVWVNGERIDGSSGSDGVHIYSKITSDNSVIVGVMNRRAVSLKPGQRLKSEDGSIEESYEADVKRIEMIEKP